MMNLHTYASNSCDLANTSLIHLDFAITFVLSGKKQKTKCAAENRRLKRKERRHL